MILNVLFQISNLHSKHLSSVRYRGFVHGLNQTLNIRATPANRLSPEATLRGWVGKRWWTRDISDISLGAVWAQGRGMRSSARQNWAAATQVPSAVRKSTGCFLSISCQMWICQQHPCLSEGWLQVRGISANCTRTTRLKTTEVFRSTKSFHYFFLRQFRFLRKSSFLLTQPPKKSVPRFLWSKQIWHLPLPIEVLHSIV